ncbi:hypothetical protein DLE01_29865 [Streptomyces sp. FT05W]|nr:hypothetical protein DLE01_29865 [Streptomyces sp. FT05W]
MREGFSRWRVPSGHLTPASTPAGCVPAPSPPVPLGSTGRRSPGPGTVGRGSGVPVGQFSATGGGVP